MRVKLRYRLLGWVLLAVAANVIVYMYDYRTEPTESIVYELDEASKEIVKKITEPIIITFYRSNNLMPLEERFADNIERTVKAYEDITETPIHIEVINLYESLEVELEATNAGIKPMEIKGRGNSLRRIFLGMIVQVGNRTEVLPQIVPHMSTEYLVSSSLRKLTELGRRKIAVLQGHGEPTIQQIQGVAKRLSPNYNLEPVVLTTTGILSEYESLLIISPSFKYSDTELDKLDAFLDLGKSIFLALDRVEYDTEEEEGYKIDTRLEEWLVRKGLIVYSNFIVDHSCSDVLIEASAPPIAFPYFPQITNFSSHAAMQGIGVIALRYASSIETASKKDVTFTALAKTSEFSGKKSLPLRINLKHEWARADYLFPEQTVAALIEGSLGTVKEVSSKIVVVSDGDVVLGDENLRELDNHLFVANIIDWLSDSTGLAALKQKGVVQEERVPEVQISALKKYINLFLPLAILGLSALFFYYRRKWHIDKLRMADF